MKDIQNNKGAFYSKATYHSKYSIVRKSTKESLLKKCIILVSSIYYSYICSVQVEAMPATVNRTNNFKLYRRINNLKLHILKKLLAILVACLMPICLIAGSGDVNGDGNFNAADIVELLNHLNGKPTKNFNVSEADVNNDGVVDENDVAALSYTILSAKIKEEQACPDSNHPHWIDLGLPSGTQWRCCNEGASTPEDYGGYYEFGQVASAPSLDQIKELLNHTTSEWTTQNGVNGRKFTGSNGGTIFLPAAGDRWDGGFYSVGSSGYYWSSTPADERHAYVLRFYSSGANWGFLRGNGHPVRPVR